MTITNIRKPTRRQRRVQHHDARIDDATSGRDKLAAAYASLRAALADTDWATADYEACAAADMLRRHANHLRRERR